MKTKQTPPNDIDIERAVLGALLLGEDCYLEIADIISAFDFYQEAHIIIYDAICNLFAENKPITLISLSRKLQDIGKIEQIGGRVYIAKLSSFVASTAHIETNAKILAQLSMRRKVITEATRLHADAYNTSIDFDGVISNAVGLVDRVLADITSNSKVQHISDVAKEYVKDLEAIQNGTNVKNRGLRTKIGTLRELIPMYKNSTVIVVAGRPGMGKTDFVLNEALNFAENGDNVLFFSLEMSKLQLAQRVIEREAYLTVYDLENKLEPCQWQSIEQALDGLKDKGLFIDDTPSMTFAHIKAKIKIYKKIHNIKAVIIDYMQLISMDKSLIREQQVSETSRQIKILSREFDIPIFNLNQLNRVSESRNDKKPIASDLRESGAIEQDADIIIFPHRPEHYDKDNQDIKGKGFFIVAKHRGGATGEVPVNIDIARHRWTSDLDEREQRDVIIEPVPDEFDLEQTLNNDYFN